MDKRQYFGTDGIRGRYGSEFINPEFFAKLGWAIGCVFVAQGEKAKILIGQDTRSSGQELTAAVQVGLEAAGALVENLGVIPTPAVATLTQLRQASAGLMISASHNPHYDNGIKIFNQQGRKISPELEEAVQNALEAPAPELRLVPEPAATCPTARQQYTTYCLEQFHAARSNSEPPAKLNVVLDCANGATAPIAATIYTQLGVNVHCHYQQPDGENINQNCGSTSPATLQDLVSNTEHADLGIAFDGDGDRVLLVAADGSILDGDDILYILAQYCLPEDQPRGIALTQMNNFGLELALQQLKFTTTRTAVGDKYILAALEANNWLLGGEPSGHIIHLSHASSGDGIIAGLLIIACMLNQNATLDELRQGLTKFPQLLTNIECQQPQEILTNAKIQDAIAQAEAELANGQGRILLRASGTEPLIRLMVEANDNQQAQLLSKQLSSLITELV